MNENGMPRSSCQETLEVASYSLITNEVIISKITRIVIFMRLGRKNNLNTFMDYQKSNLGMQIMASNLGIHPRK